MKPYRICWIVMVAVMLCAALLCVPAWAEGNASYAGGEWVTIEGTLTIEKDGIMILKFSEPLDFVRIRDGNGILKNYKNQTEIPVLTSGEYIDGSVRVRGILTDNAKVGQAYVLAGASVERMPAVRSVTMPRKSVTIEVGKTFGLSAAVKPLGASEKLTWKSSSESVATVTQEGVVTAVSAGKATITAESANGKKASAAITATKPVTGVKLNKTTLAVVKGKQVKLTATVSPSDATNKKLTWSSKNTKIATVDQKGNVKGVNVGTTTITVKTKDGGFKASCKVTVKVPVKSVKLNQSELYVEAGKITKLTATISPSDATNKKITWSSKNTKIATVDQKGNVKGVKAGSTTITVKANDGGVKATCKVMVVKKIVPVTSVTLNKKALTLAPSETAALTASIKPSSATDKGILWSSNKASVATVDSNGRVTGKKAGTATITAKSRNGSKKASCKVTVKENILTVNLDMFDSMCPIQLKIGQQVRFVGKNFVWNKGDWDWQDFKSSVVSVDSKGVFTGKKEGITSIQNFDIGKEVFFYVTNKSISTKPINKNDLLFYVEGKEFSLGTVTISQLKKQLPGGKDVNVENDENVWGDYQYVYKGIVFTFHVGDWDYEWFWGVTSIADGSPFRTYRGVESGAGLFDVIGKYGFPDMSEADISEDGFVYRFRDTNGNGTYYDGVHEIYFDFSKKKMTGFWKHAAGE